MPSLADEVRVVRNAGDVGTFRMPGDRPYRPPAFEPQETGSLRKRERIVGIEGERSCMDSADLDFDEAFVARAKRRAKTAWARVVDLTLANHDDPDEVASTPSERVALVDTLLLAAYRAGVEHGTEPRLQRSVERVLKRGS